MSQKNPANFTVLAAHVLRIADDCEPQDGIANLPSDRVTAVAALIELCFGPDGARAIALDLLTDLDELDAAQREAHTEPSPLVRQNYVAEFLQKEFSDDH